MYDLIVVGGGPAGLAAACKAWDEGVKHILVLERDRELGGILNQCIHNGFGLQRFKEELTGPEYAGRYIDMLRATGVEARLDTMVLQIVPGEGGAPHQVHAINGADGYMVLETKTVVLAMGCRERTRGAISTPGERCAGIFTAGAAQRFLNMEGYMVGRRVVILGSGDIGLIMARRMTLEGAKVLACVELMPYSGGLTRNIVQCLEDYGIPLYLSHTITDIKGHQRVEQVTVSQVGPDRRPVPGTEMVFDCDTVLLSVGLIPENELTRQAGITMDRRTSGAVVYENMETGVPGIFACGNVVHVHDLVDYVSAESERAGAAAAAYVQGKRAAGDALELQNGDGVSYTVPQHLRLDALEKPAQVFFRVNRVTKDAQILATDADGKTIARFKREHMAPGEMEQIGLPPQLLKQARGPLTLRIQEV
ncbi:MAG TPA: NAD(P)/FAD-dependent oxidoreductase [Candidatus Fournierella merdavium]|uniref:NAD(P)/FAD-dependent oxidoreductase n=1 Tax=Candidatus Allofournierella merdavium TaxID=2838593 RepID=UPI001F919329|nr:NAD(P)/FAD-dependent oxidoreductase [Candidatus Fournierella merdavium]